MKDIVAVVIDRSTSQTLGDRAAHDRRRSAPSCSAASARSPTSSRASSRPTTARATTARACSRAVERPRRRAAGPARRRRSWSPTARCTTSRASAASLGFRAPAACARHRPPGRARPADQAARGAALRHRRHATRPSAPQVIERGGTGSALVTVRRDGQPIRRASRCAPTRRSRSTVRIEHGGPNVVEIEAEALAERADHRQQPRRRHDRGHPREAARAAGLRRAACRRAHLAQPAEVGRQRRPRALHHPAPAGEAGRHADQRAVADRLPDARAVPAEDQGVRPDHLRPLRATRASCRSTYFDNIVRYVREGGAVLVAAGPEFAGDVEPRAARRSRRSSPATPNGRIVEEPYKAAHHRQAASAIRSPATCRARRQTPPAWGEWLRIVGVAGPQPARPLMSGAERPAAAGARTARTRAASRCCSPITPGCGRAATRAAARISTCCAASPTG